MTVPTIRISSPAELLGVVPFLLGFTPEDSVVVVVLRHGRVALTARVDAVDAVDQMGYLPQVIAQAQGTELLVVGYGVPARAVVQPFADVLVAACDGVELLESCFVDTEGDRYRVFSTRETGCYSELRYAPAAVEMVASGVAPRASRDELVAALTPGADPMPEGFARGFAGTLPHIADWSDEELAQAVRDALADLLDAPEPEGRLLGALAALMTRAPARLAALDLIDQTTSLVQRPFWERMVRLTGGAAALGPLVCSAVAAWQGGDGAGLNIGADRLHQVLGDDPGEEVWMLSLVDFVADHALPPQGWPMLRERVHELNREHAEAEVVAG